MVNLSSMPSALYARHGRDNTPNRVTVDEMRRKLPIGATGFKMFRTASGKPANAFCEYVRRDGARVAKYHDTEILALHPNGDVVAGFDGWHTLMTPRALQHRGRGFRVAAPVPRDRPARHDRVPHHRRRTTRRNPRR